MPPKGTKAGAKNYGAAKEARREARYAAKEGGTTMFNNAQGLFRCSKESTLHGN